MKVKNVRVRMFRNMLDSTDVSIQPDVTCLVGKNESGKTAFLQALWRLDPARLKPVFSIPDDYPAWLEKRHRNEGRKLEEVHPIEVTYAWDEPDSDAIEERFGPGVAQRGIDLIVWKTYGNAYGWRYSCDEKKAVENLLAGQKLPQSIGKTLKGAETFAEVGKRITADLEAHEEEAEVVAALNKVSSRVKELLEDEQFNSAIWKLIYQRIPLFFYFADYSKLPYSAKIRHVLEAGDEKLNDSEATARAASPRRRRAGLYS